MEKSIKKIDDKTLEKIAGGLETPLTIDDIFNNINIDRLKVDELKERVESILKKKKTNGGK